ncbi:hypothetical protein BT69DRAFT_1263177 [Atractiella rhizophila]|nr:hypothetical protein BT69DRAFT_1263177 [Atractiella rhizophila]
MSTDMPARKKRRTRQQSPPQDKVISGLPEGWQKKGVQYWEGVEASVDGVLGGFGQSVIPRMDALGSRMFIHSLFPSLSPIPSPTIQPVTSLSTALRSDHFVALDAGAGIGRVTKEVLLPLMDEVHLVEPVAKFLAQAKKEVEDRDGRFSLLDAFANGKRKRVRMFNVPLQDFDPSSHPNECYFSSSSSSDEKEDRFEGKYHLIWIQWCLPHLTDAEIIRFLKASKAALTEGGYVCVKENLVMEGVESLRDEEDWSVTRSEKDYRNLFAAAEMKLIRVELQRGFPEECFAVKMFALQ